MMSEILTPTYCNDDHDRNCECPYKSSVGRHPAAETNKQIVNYYMLIEKRERI